MCVCVCVWGGGGHKCHEVYSICRDDANVKNNHNNSKNIKAAVVNILRISANKR